MDGRLGDLLQPVVQGGGDPKPTGLDHPRAVCVRQDLEDVIDKPGREHVPLDGAVLEDELLLEGCVVLELADVAVAQHGVEHELLPVTDRDRGPSVVGIEFRGSVRYPGQHGGLRDVQVLGRLGEVRLRGCLGSVCLVSEEDLVQVEGEDLVLRVAALDLEGEHRLLDLSVD